MRVLGLTMIAKLIALGCGQVSLQAKGPLRSILYSYHGSGLIVIMGVQETGRGANGHVTVIGASMAHPVLESDFYVPGAEFEQMWSTLNAAGVEKYRLTKQHDLADYYVFLAGDQKYAVSKGSSARAVSVLSSRMRTHVDGVMKIRMAPWPVTRAIPKPR